MDWHVERRPESGCKNQTSTTLEKLRGIYFIDPEDGESEETGNARNKLEVPFEAAMTSKTETTKRARKPQESVASGSTEPNKKTKYACIVEAHESTRKRFRFTLPRNLELVGFLCCCHVLSCFGSFGLHANVVRLPGGPTVRA